MQQLANRLVEWLRTQVTGAGASGLVLGMSGGVDSSVAAVLCQVALPDKTLALFLPCHSIPEDIDHARQVAEQFRIRTALIALDSVYDSLVAATGEGQGGGQIHNTPSANVKPRLRMAMLYYFANKFNYLVVGSSNRCELAIGYFTKYGDGGVDIMPLGNLVKSQVREMARYLGIPPVIIDKAPSAGLWQGQTDEQEMGITYDDLDAYFSTQPVPDEVRLKIERRMARNAHKTALPPVPLFYPTIVVPLCLCYHAT